MKPSQVVILGVVFAGSLFSCFMLLDFSTKKLDPVQPASQEPIAPSVNSALVNEPVLPTPKLPSAALGGFGQVAKLERGYDGTAFLADVQRGSSQQIGRGSATPFVNSATPVEPVISDQ